MNSSNHENGENLAFSRKFLFLPSFRLLINQNQKNFRNPNGKSFRSTSNVICSKKYCRVKQILQLQFFKIPQIPKHFSAMLKEIKRNLRPFALERNDNRIGLALGRHRFGIHRFGRHRFGIHRFAHFNMYT